MFDKLRDKVIILKDDLLDDYNVMAMSLVTNKDGSITYSLTVKTKDSEAE